MEDPLGPKNLDLAFGKIKSAIDLKRAKSNGHQSRPANNHNKFCPICQKTFHHQAILVDPDIKPMVCPECQKQLDEGMIAVTAVDGRYAFIYSAHLAGAEQIQQVSAAVMDKVQEKFKLDHPSQTPTQNN